MAQAPERARTIGEVEAEIYLETNRREPDKKKIDKLLEEHRRLTTDAILENVLRQKG